MSNELTYPVLTTARLADGQKAKVQIGVATRQEDGSFLIASGVFSIGAETTATRPASNGGPTFPNYGKSKGAPIFGASAGDLAFYAGGCRKSLADPSKERFHDKERAMLAAIEAEMVRQGMTPEPQQEAAPYEIPF